MNTCSVISSLKLMLPTACFSIRNSRSPTGSTLTEASCDSDKSMLGGLSDARLEAVAGAPGALAFGLGAPSPELVPSLGWAGTYANAKAAMANPTAATATPTVLVVFPVAIDSLSRARNDARERFANTKYSS